MNKKLKIASAAVAVVMAGTMAFGMFGCGGGGDNGGDSVVKPKLDESGKLTWAANTQLNLNVGNSNTKQQGISYTSSDLSGNTYMPDGKQYGAGALKPAWAALQTQLSTTSALKLNDSFQNLGSGDQVSTPIKNNNLSDYDVITGSLEEINKNSGSFLNLTDYLEYMPNYKAFLDANPVTKYSLTGDYKGGMYAAPYFDGNDDIEKYSMVNHNWVKEILDGNDTKLATYTGTFKEQADAKKAKADYGAIVSNASSATAYMGTDGSYTVDTTDPNGTADANGVIGTVKLKVNYGAALEAATGTSALATAISDATGGTAYPADSTSGNIVDIQNFIINTTQGEVSGGKLAKVLQEYIKVAYQTEAGAQFYTKLSDVFLSASAGWDVDLLVAMSRCVVCSATALSNSKSDVEDVFAIAGRQQTTQRRVDLMALAGELYGVRGLESRYEYTYFDANGQIQDARGDASTYDILNNFNSLTKEGLVYIGTNDMTAKYTKVEIDVLTKPKSEGGEYGYVLKTKTEDGVEKDGYYDEDGKLQADTQGNLLSTVTYSATTIATDNSGVQTFMLHDYVQTQTLKGMGLADTKYNFGPIVNAVSKWDVDGDGDHTDIMRFTESWRSVKNTGFCVPKSITGNTDKLSAVLAFIDYFFSTDGQLLMSYGPQSVKGNTEDADGWWYANEVTDKTPAEVGVKLADATNYAPAQYSVKKEYKGQYFIYNEKVYTGLAYNGTQIPVLTDLNASFYHGNSTEVITGYTTNQQGQEVPVTVSIKTGGGTGNNILISAKDNYTNYARYVIGSTLPIGNKNQGFEYQATATAGINGAATVTKALLNGTLKHVKLTLDENESPWYLITPTALPMTANEQQILKDSNQTKISGTYFYNNSKTNQTTNILIDILYYGLGSSANVCGQESLGNYKTYNTGAKIVTLINSSNFQNRVGIMENGWYAINKQYNLGYELD